MRFSIPTTFSHRLGFFRQIECDGFYQGAHGVAMEPGLVEIKAYNDRRSAELKQKSVHREKDLEAKLDHLRMIAPHLERLWEAVQARVSDRVPHFILPFLVAGVGILAIWAEAILLAPAMDVLNVSKRSEQLVAALGLAAVSALVYHFCWTSFTDERMRRVWRLACRVVGVLVTAGLICWGVLRGYQVAYAAGIAGNPLGEFLARHFCLSSIFFTFITVAMPVVAAAAAHFAGIELHDAWEWRTTKWEVERLSRDRTLLTKRLEAERGALVHALAGLCEQSRTWCASFEQHYQRGREQGSVQEPYWTVPLRATWVTLVVALFAGWLFLILSPLFSVMIPMVWIAAFLYFRREWQSPGPVTFFHLGRVRFAATARDADDAHRRPASWFDGNAKVRE